MGVNDHREGAFRATRVGRVNFIAIVLRTNGSDRIRLCLCVCVCVCVCMGTLS